MARAHALRVARLSIMAFNAWGTSYRKILMTKDLGRVRLQLQIESGGSRSVRLIWRLSNLELLQIGNRVKFARFTVYSS